MQSHRLSMPLKSFQAGQSTQGSGARAITREWVCMNGPTAAYADDARTRARSPRNAPKYATGQVYHGEWKNGTAVGNGVKHYPAGSVYHGQWMGDRQEGFGVYSWPDGDVRAEPRASNGACRLTLCLLASSPRLESRARTRAHVCGTPHAHIPMPIPGTHARVRTQA